MGWISWPIDQRPTNEELNDIAEQWLSSPDYDIIDRSGWIKWNHQFLLTELKPETLPELPARRNIVVVQVKINRHEVFYRAMSEEVGHGIFDCPMRLLKKAEMYPPYDEHAAQWRQGVREYHKRNREIESLLNHLDSLPMDGDRRIVITVNQCTKTVRYLRARQKRRNIRVFQDPEDPKLYFLQKDMIEIEATLGLRQNALAA